MSVGLQPGQTWCPFTLQQMPDAPSTPASPPSGKASDAAVGLLAAGQKDGTIDITFGGCGVS